MNLFLHRLRAIASILTVLFMVTLGLGTAAATAQSGDDSYTFESNDKELTWSSPWENDPSTNSNESDVELVGLFSNNAFMIVGTVPNILPLEEARDVIVDSFADGLVEDRNNIDEGAYDNFSYSFDEGTIEGVPFGIFTLFRGGEGDVPTELQVFFGVTDEFAVGFASAQEDVSWDGDQLFNGVDGQGLEDQLGQAVSDDESADDGAEEEETPPADEEEGSDDPIGDVKNRAGGDEDADETPEGEEETPADDEEETPQDEDSGEAGSWVGENSGVEVTFSSDFEIDSESAEDGTDSLTLVSGNVAIANVIILPSEGVTADLLNDTLADSPDVILADGDAEVAGNVIYTEGVVVYTEILLVEDGEYIAVINLGMAEGDLADALPMAQDGIEVGGQPAFSLFTVEDIEAELP